MTAVDTWTPIDAGTTMTVADATLHTRLADANRTLSRLWAEWPALTHLLRDHMADGIRSTGGDPPMPWCWAHEQPVDRCWAAGMVLCSGDPGSPTADPVGSAAVAGDRAATDLRAARRHVETVIEAVTQLDGIAGQYPRKAMMRPVEPTPGVDYCTSCWRIRRPNGRPVEREIERDGNGHPYYRGLCRWCGEARKLLDGVLPTVELTRKMLGPDFLGNGRPNELDWKRAREQTAEQRASKRKRKTKR